MTKSLAISPSLLIIMWCWKKKTLSWHFQWVHGVFRRSVYPPITSNQKAQEHDVPQQRGLRALQQIRERALCGALCCFPGQLALGFLGHPFTLWVRLPPPTTHARFLSFSLYSGVHGEYPGAPFVPHLHPQSTWASLLVCWVIVHHSLCSSGS